MDYQADYETGAEVIEGLRNEYLMIDTKAWPPEVIKFVAERFQSIADWDFGDPGYWVINMTYWMADGDPDENYMQQTRFRSVYPERCLRRIIDELDWLFSSERAAMGGCKHVFDSILADATGTILVLRHDDDPTDWIWIGWCVDNPEADEPEDEAVDCMSEEQFLAAQGPRFPEVEVKLVGEDGNGMAIIGRVRRAMQRAGIPKEEIAHYMDECLEGDYDNLLATTMRYVEVI
jgi:hypothetical protein